MANADWDTIQAAFQRALELDAPARETFLGEFADAHPELIAQLRNLLAADAKEIDLAGPIAASLKTLLESSVDPWIGRQIGVWTIRERLATGGMGSVFVADRTDRQFAQRVAIKLMNAQLLTPDAIVRFKAERQILADLHHPYIAQLYDGGATEDGVPYLVMEYVEGERVDRHCDTHDLDIDARLALFRKICAAVDYAHRQLTVHRDLKPSNILIDTHGNPKLLDFGIAKLLDTPPAAMTVAITRDGSRAMTPEYASPEQVRGETISVATDVYSLGVLLYRLMTGHSPYGLTNATPLEYERAIVDHTPKRPSAAITPADTSSTGPQRVLPVASLRKRLTGDLDNIVLKTLQKEPERRYLSVNALSDDIERYLQHRPVEARGADWPYVTKKFLARNTRGAAITAAVLVGITALVTFYTLQLADERDRANAAAQEASEVASFLASVFASASPLVQQGEAISAIDLLEQGAERIEALTDQPALQAELYRVMGASFTQLGNFGDAELLLEKSRALRDGDASVEPLLLAETLEDLAEAQRELRDNDPAIANLRRALTLRRQIHGEEHAEVARVMSRLGAALGGMGSGDSEEALETLRAALAMKQRLGAEPDIVTSDILGNIAVRLDTLGRYDEAAEVGREAIAMSELVNGPLHPYTVVRMSNQALVLRRQFELEASAALFADTIARARQTFPNDHPRLAFYVQSYGQVLGALGRFDESLPRLEEAADIARAGPGEESLLYAGALYGIGNWYADRGDYAEAIRIFERARDLALRLQGESGYFVVLVRLSLGGAQLGLGQWQQAEDNLRSVIDNEAQVGRDLTLRARAWLALVYANEGRADEGEPLIRDSLAAGAANDEASQITLLGLATEFFRLAGNLEESIAIGERVYRIAQERLPAGNWLGARATGELGRSLHAAGREDEARPYLESAARDLAAVFGNADARVARLTALLD